MRKSLLLLLSILLATVQSVSAYTPSTGFQIKLESTTEALDLMLEKKGEVYRTRFLRVLDVYKSQYIGDEKATYVLDYISKNLTTMTSENCIVFDDFSNTNDSNWIIVNDGVMGGLSKGNILTENETMMFSGNINTNGGGFTSIRSSLANGALDTATHITLKAKADSRSYNITFRDGNWRGITYQTQIPFQTPGSFEEIKIPITDLKPTFFGNRVNASNFQKNEAREIGFIISDGINGTFQLEIESISFCEE